MIDNIFFQYSYLTLALVSLLVNIPLGYIRENHPKFSFKWLFWIHASIPLIIYVRFKLGVPGLFIPASIFIAIIGQILGGQWRKKQMTDGDIERLQQIPSIDHNSPATIADSEVMVALLNMGGPKTNSDVRDFQNRLFSDPLLIRFPLSWAFQKLFAAFLIALRSKTAEARYQLIGGGSPIFESTKSQVKALQDELDKRGRSLKVTFSFNYSPPLPDETIHEVQSAGRKHLLPVSLYPHYSKATTGSNIHYLKESAKTIYPQLQFLNTPDYYLHEKYIQAFTDRILEQIRPSESLDDFYLLFSAHGLPLYFLTQGDPYPFQISQTVAQILANLKRRKQWTIAYQSAVGPLQWLKPATGDMITALAKKGVKKLIIIPISFVVDHIETTCEIDMEYRQKAEDLGIDDFRMSKALECHPGFIEALADTVEEALQTPHDDRSQIKDTQIPTNV